MALVLGTLYKSYKNHRAEKAGVPYEGDEEAVRLPLYESELQDGTRLPDPTPEEITFLKRNGLGTGIDFKNWRKYFTKEYYTVRKTLHIIVIQVVLALVILVLVYEDPIIDWLEPFGEKWKNLPAGWLIPIAILIVQSFPPLLGQEVIQILAGVIWGIGPGFAIVAAGTILGEIIEFYVYRLLCARRTDKFEKKSLPWGLLAHISRDAGFTMVLMCRLSVLPAHFTTIVFALAGTNFFKFLAALVLSLAMPLANVYLGVLARESAEGKSSSASSIANGVTIAASVAISIAAMFYIHHKADKAKSAFITQRRLARFQSQSGSPTPSSTAYNPSTAYDPESSATHFYSTPYDQEASAGRSFATPRDTPPLGSHSTIGSRV